MKKVKIIFSVFFVAVFCMGEINAQIMPAITKVALLEQDDATINQRLSEYTTFTMDKRGLADSLNKYGKYQFQRKHLGPAREELVKMMIDKNENVLGSAGRG